MAGKNSNASKEMSADLKKDGVARRTVRCPVCHAALSSSVRVTPGENNEKGFSHFDFAGTLFGHFARGCK